MQQSNTIFRKVFVGIFSLVVLFIAISFIFNYLSTGKINAKTNDSTANVQIKQILGSGTKKSDAYSKMATSKLSVKLKPGRYQVLIFNKSSSVAQFVNLKARQNYDINLNPPKPLAVEPVYGSGAFGLTASNSQMTFVDLAASTLNKVDTQNKIINLDQNHLFSGARWANQSLGIALGKNNKLYSIKNGVVTLLPLSFETTQDVIGYDISKDGTVYVSSGKNVYAGNVNGSFKKIYTSSVSGPALYAGNGRVLIVDSSGEDNGSIVVAGPSVQPTKREIEKTVDAGQFAWSHSGKYLLAIGEEGDLILDSSLKTLANIDIEGGGSFAWKDDSNFYYSVSNQLWVYNLATNIAQNIATVPSGQGKDGAIGQIIPAQNSNYVYLSAQKFSLSSNNNNAYELYRVNLKGGAVAENIQGIDIFLPETVSGCQIDYLNFTKASINVRYPQNSSAAACLDVAKTELQNYDTDPNKFLFNATPIGIGGE